MSSRTLVVPDTCAPPCVSLRSTRPLLLRKKGRKPDLRLTVKILKDGDIRN